MPGDHLRAEPLDALPLVDRRVLLEGLQEPWGNLSGESGFVSALLPPGCGIFNTYALRAGTTRHAPEGGKRQSLILGVGSDSSHV